MTPTNSPAPMLEAIALSASHGAMRVVRNVDLAVSAGEILALFGPNGAGKTSLVEAMAGRVTSSGTLSVGGQRIDHLPGYKRAKRGLALVPDTRGLFRTMSVEENLALGARLAAPSDRADLLERALVMFPVLSDRRKQQAGLMSGGEQQMLAIAKAFVANPRVLILDEPTQGLAPRILEGLIDVIRRLKDQGLAILLVEQNYAFARALADRAVVLTGGEVVRRMERTELNSEGDIVGTYMGSTHTETHTP